MFTGRLEHPLKNIFIGIIYEDNHEHSRLKLSCSDTFLLFGRGAEDVNEATNCEPVRLPEISVTSQYSMTRRLRSPCV